MAKAQNLHTQKGRKGREGRRERGKEGIKAGWGLIRKERGSSVAGADKKVMEVSR